MKFTKEHRERLIFLIGTLVLARDNWAGGRLGTPISPNEVVDLTVAQLESEVSGIDKILEKKKNVSRWKEEDSESRHTVRFEQWRELFDLVIGWKISNEERAKKAAETRKLKAEIEALEDAAMSPAEKLEKKKKLLEELSEAEG